MQQQNRRRCGPFPHMVTVRAFSEDGEDWVVHFETMRAARPISTSLKRLAKPALRGLTAALYRNRPLASWPALVGRLHDISVPRAVIPNPTARPTGGANINNLTFLLERTRDIPGDVAECGVYQGASLIPMAIWATQHNIPKTFFGYDSFEGFPDSIAEDQNMGGADIEGKRPGGMNETSLELVASKLKLFHLGNVRLRKGLFSDTLNQDSWLRFSLAHLDCDIYDSYTECLNFFYPRMSVGAVILLDEYNDPPWPGCNKAVDEFLAELPESLQLISLDNYEKYYIVKQ